MTHRTAERTAPAVEQEVRTRRAGLVEEEIVGPETGALEASSPALPWKALVPDLMLMLVTPPWVWPNWASKVSVWTLNSCTMSVGGT